MNPPRSDLRWSIWEIASYPCVWNECPGGCTIGAAGQE
jgi:hypothetical protein